MAGNFQQDLRGGLRMLKKSPGFTFVAVLSLALGIGANTAIFTIINAVFLHPLPVEEPSRLAELFTRDTITFNANANFQLTGTSLPNYEDYRDQNNVFSGLATVTFPIPLNWGGQAEPQQLNASLVSGNFFDVLGVKPYRGRTFIADGDKKIGGNPEVVLSYSLWARRFGSDEKFIGQTILLNGTPYTVVGIAPPGFKGIVSLGRPDLLWIPITMRDYVLTGQLKDLESNRRFRWLSIVGRLKPPVDLVQARAAMKTVAAGLEKEYPRDNKGRTVELFSLNESALGINQRKQFSLAGGVLMSVVGLVLLIACVNLANLLLAQAAKREKELSIRAAMGAGRFRLVRQLLTESTVLSLLGSLRYYVDAAPQFFRGAIWRVKTVLGVAGASVWANGVFGGGLAGTMFREGEQTDPNNRGTLVNFDDVTPGLFATMRIPLISGRDFANFDRENTTRVAIINEDMAKAIWPGQEPPGKRFAIVKEPELLQVIGVVGTAVIGQIGEDPQPIAYVPMRQQYSPFATLVVRTNGNPEPLIGAVRAQVQQIDKNLAFTNAQTVQQILGQGLWAARMGAALLGLFGALALILASIGIYGVLAYSVAQRTSEIGLRMALGAQPRQVLGLVLKQGMLLATIGAAVGIVVALPVARMAGNLLYGVSTTDPLTYVGITLLLMAVALLACYLPARRATRIDPLIALRVE